MRGVALLVLASCGGGWKPVVWNEGPADRDARPVSIQFPDGTNGTALLMKLRADAKAIEASGISAIELQVGACTREIAPAPREVAIAAVPDLDRIVVHLVEKKVTCGTTTDQQLTHAPTEHGSKPGFGETEVVTSESCSLDDVEVTALRYRFEVDHVFTPPDWDAIDRWSHVRLAMGAPRCGGAAKNELRAVFHRAEGPRMAAAANTEEPAIDPAKIAMNHAHAIDADVDAFLARKPPEGDLETWSKEVAGDIDRVAKRFEHIKDLVRTEEVGVALRYGAQRLAAMHEHLATLLDAAKQPAAAEAERAKARALAP